MTELRIPPKELVDLSPLHEEFRAKYRTNAPPEWFSWEVGNKLILLPQDKIDYQTHLPVCRPDTLDGIGFGWAPCDFMLVVPAVTSGDVSYQACLTARWGQFLKDELRKVGMDLSRVLVTHALRFPLTEGRESYGQRQKTACATYVRSDCYGCNPKAIITFGADALKALFGKDAKLDNLRGTVHDWQGIPVIPTVSPLVFAKSLGGLDVFQSELFRAMEVSMGTHKAVTGWQPGYRVIRTADEVEALEAELNAADAKHVSIDTEFGNNTGREEHGFLMSFQVAWGRGKAAFIKLRKSGGEKLQEGEELYRVRQSIVRMMMVHGRRLSGQHLRIDVEMPSREGMNFDDKLETGFDTMLANWLLRGSEGDEGRGLDHLVRRYEPQHGAYWAPLEKWLDSKPLLPDHAGVVEPRSRKWILQFGYRFIPDEIIEIYGLIDADATWCIAEKLMVELDAQPKMKELFENITMPASLHLLDVERQGILQDRKRVQELFAIYQPEYDRLLAEFRSRIAWPDFNPASSDQKAAFLFSTTNYRDHASWLKKGHIPEGAKLLTLDPLFNTNKYPIEWSKIVEEGEEDRHRPSAKSATIDLLYQKHKHIPELRMLKHLSVLGKFLSDYLAEAPLNELGFKAAGKSIASSIWEDGRARGHLSQTTSTSRCSMRAANLQTTPKKQEDAALAVFVDRQFGGMELDEYKICTNDKKEKELGDRFIPKEKRIRISSFKSSYIPQPGNILIEVDFKTAELCVLAYASGDLALMEIIDRGRDLHAETALKSFNLPGADELRECLTALSAAYAANDKTAIKAAMKAYKEWLHPIKEGVYSALRTAAKTIIFGVMYGRGAYALAREISKTGNAVTPDDCQKIIDTFAAMFPKAWAWLQANMDSAIENGYVANPFGFRRYFHGIKDMSKKDQAAARREASNAPIQGCVAHLLLVAGINLYRFRYRTEIGRKIGFKVTLPIHDAFLIECPAEFEKETIALIEACMSKLNVIPGTGRNLGIDVTVYPTRWGSHEDDPDVKKAA